MAPVYHGTAFLSGLASWTGGVGFGFGLRAVVEVVTVSPVMNNSAPLWRFAFICAFLAPLILLIGDTIAVINFLSISWTLLLWLSFLCFIPALAGLAIAVQQRAPLLGLVGGMVVLIGTMAGAGMQAYFRAGILLQQGGQDNAVAFLRTQSVMPLTTQVPGIAFPVGLLILAAAIWRSRIAPAWIAGVLAIGAVLFPIGHAARVSWALLGGDLVLLVAFVAIAQRILSPAK